MRLDNTVLIFSSITTSCAVVAGDVSIYARQTDGGTTTTSAVSSGVLSAQPSQTTSTSTSFAAEHSISATASASTTMIDIHTDLAAGTVTQPTAVPISANATNATQVNANALPIEPEITPALGVAGVVLIILGMCYNLIGIKNQWLHVFLSAAFSTSLAVTVLIVYVMSPPVSNAVQGAYFVAAFFTGVIFGALSLVFKELTEGLGCLLGGFCLSMWILALKAGGLLTSSGIKAGFIAAFCVASYALSFSSYTRPYALIGSTAFAGGTAAVLGIDCFSRAGLKEFWLYIWDLNDNIFPLDTTTYPITRGIRVELAVIVIICLMGLLSQFRLWRVVRERRKRQTALQEEEKRKKDEAEAEMGRKFEEDNMRELARWEAVYGNRENRQSTSGKETEETESPRKCSTATEVAEAPGDTVEMTNQCQPGRDSTQPTTIQEEIHEKEGKGNETGSPNTEDPDNPEAAGQDQEEGAHPEETAPVQTDPSPMTPPPTVTPLPFKVPDPADIPKNNDGHSIRATCDDAESIATRLSRRLSGSTFFRRLSRNSSRMPSESEEMLVPIQPASPASSVQGVMDGDDESEFDLQDNASERASQAEDLSEAGMESRRETHKQKASGASPKVEETPVQNGLCSTKVQEAPLQHDQLSENSQEGQEGNDLPQKSNQSEPCRQGQQVFARDGSKVAPQADSKRKQPPNLAAFVLPAGQVFCLSPVTSPPMKSSDAASEKEETVKKGSSSRSQSRASTGRKASLTAGAVERLPSHVSPVVMSYRTNEWAKHLSEADTPELEPIQPVQDDSADVEHRGTEVAAPVRVGELQQTATNAPPPPARESRVSEEPMAYTVNRSSSVSKQSAHECSPIGYADGMAAQASRLAREPAASSPNLLMSGMSAPHPHPAALRGLHSSSSPFLNTSLAAAPIHQSAVANFQHTQADEPVSLLAQRESMVRSRISSVSLSRDSWLPPRSYFRQSFEEGRLSCQASQLSLLEDDDDMPLSQRRTLLRMATDPKSTSGDSNPVNNRAWRESNRSKAQMTMAAWRVSLREDLTRSQTPLADVNIARSSMLEQQRKAQLAKQQRKMASEYIDNCIAEKMQRGEMRDLHREVLRRMQAVANRQVMGGD
ncbi:hypothetical protein VTN77DRAFT_2948 [Rasamsonia byssochlamydoides]|uniref:uncharacterized protein n=1 Tax=Rasamsonia byssochlamydoides TaxID=89139 RepID=UPI00374414B1